MRTRFASLVALGLSAVLLASCSGNLLGGGTTLTYTMTFDSEDTGRNNDLASAAARVMERRLLALKQEVQRGDVSVQGNTLTVKAKDADTAAKLNEQLERPFDMRIMVEADEASADITSDKYGAFKETPVGNKETDWVLAKPTSEKGMASATIGFTAEGKTLLKNVFQENVGKKMGIFLRGSLMSQKVIEPSDVQSSITVEGIPSLELASVFADDANVGLHVTFSEVK